MKKLVRVAVLIAACACVGVFVLQSQSRDLQDDDGIVLVNGRWHVPETVMDGPFIARRTPNRSEVHFDINECHPLVPLHAPPVVNVDGIILWEAERWPADVVAAFQTDLETEARKKCLAALKKRREQHSPCVGWTLGIEKITPHSNGRVIDVRCEMILEDVREYSGNLVREKWLLGKNGKLSRQSCTMTEGPFAID